MNHEGVVNPDGLRNWYAAVANRENVPATVMVIGDSVSEGVICTTPTYLNRWQYQLQTLLRTAFPTAGVTSPGVGYMPSLYADTLIADDTSRSGAVDILTQWGLGLKCVTVTPAQTITWPAQTCERIRVWYGKSNFLAGGGKVLVDGVDQGVTLSSVGASNTDGYVWDSGSLTLGSHTVTLQGNTSNRFFAEAVEFYTSSRDAAAGIRVYDAAHSGARSDTYLTAAADLGHWQAVATLKPRLVIMMLGINDWGNITPGDYATNMTSMLSKVATACGTQAYSVLLALPYKPVKTNGATDADWKAYDAALRALAVGNVSYLPLQPPWPQLYANTANDLMYETVSPTHPKQAGHTELAALFAQAITPPAPAAPKGTYLPLTPKAVLP